MKYLYNLISIVNSSGLSALNIGNNFGANYISTNYQDIINDPKIEAILIATRHDSHSSIY